MISLFQLRKLAESKQPCLSQRVDPDADICYCEAKHVQSFYASIARGEKRDFDGYDGRVLILDEVSWCQRNFFKRVSWSSSELRPVMSSLAPIPSNLAPVWVKCRPLASGASFVTSWAQIKLQSLVLF